MAKSIKIFLLFVFCLFFLLRTHAASEGTVYKIEINDYIIQPVVAEYIENAIEKAETERAALLLIRIDTPGGLLQSTRSIVKKMMNAEVPIVVYVAPAGARAASAGVFITLAAHIAAMAPGTHMGAAHPVQLGREDGEGKEFGSHDKPKKQPDDSENAPMETKIMQDTLAWVQNIAETRGRNTVWAGEAVEKSISSTAEELKKLKVIDFLAADETELLQKLDGKTVVIPSGKVRLETKSAEVVLIPLSWRQAILNVLIHPNIAYILLTLGFYGLLFEITHPGSWVPGVAGLICLLLAFYSFHVIPTDFAGILLTVIGLLLLGAEIFVTSYGLLALGGIVCLFFGALFLIDTPADYLKLSLRIALPTIVSGCILFGILSFLVLRTHRRKIATGGEGMIGMIGKAATAIAPKGKVFIHGELWKAESEEPIAKGERVEILRLDNLKLFVKKSF